MSLALYHRGVANYLSGNNKVLQRIINSPLLHLDGRRLLKARHFMRLQDFMRALELLNRARCSSNLIFEGDRLFLLGNCHAFRGQWQLAREFNEKAIEVYNTCSYRRGQFLSHYNLSVDLQHLGDLRGETQYLRKAKGYAETAEEKVLVDRAQAFLYARAGEFESALKLLDSTLEVEDLNAIDQVQIQILRVEILTLSGDFDAALKLSQTLLNRKSTFERARIVFENHALRFLMKDTSVFSSERPAVLASSNEYQLKWDLVRALKFGEQDRAQVLWNELSRELPGHLLSEFLKTSEYESKAIFGRCLEKLKNAEVKSIVVPNHGLEARLIEILSSTQVPVRKEILIELLWSTKYCSSLDNRFYQLVQRLKKKGVEIQNTHFAYRL